MDPALRARTLDRLRTGLQQMPLRMRAVAKYVIDNPAEFGLDPIRDTAR
jgi:DNA-binding MurR/RpiR family transcriptional regulator